MVIRADSITSFAETAPLRTTSSDCGIHRNLYSGVAANPSRPSHVEHSHHSSWRMPVLVTARSLHGGKRFDSGGNRVGEWPPASRAVAFSAGRTAQKCLYSSGENLRRHCYL